MNYFTTIRVHYINAYMCKPVGEDGSTKSQGTPS